MIRILYITVFFHLFWKFELSLLSLIILLLIFFLYILYLLFFFYIQNDSYIFFPSFLYIIIYIGGIFSPDQFEQATVFRYAIDRLNNDNNMAIGSSGSNGNNNARILPKTKLQANIVQINLDDSFHGHKQGMLMVISE